MISVPDYSHLKLLYDKFREINSQIKELIKNENIDELDIVVQEKESVLRQIIFFEKSRIKDIKENSELNSIRLNLVELEKENIELLKSVKENMTKELTDIKRTKSVINAYEPSLNQMISTIDIKDTD